MNTEKSLTEHNREFIRTMYETAGKGYLESLPGFMDDAVVVVEPSICRCV